MPMLVMQIRDVCVSMTKRGMAVKMAMASFRHRIMLVPVMTVIMAMGVLVLHRLVKMIVPVRLREVQHHA
jgi:hypothetical protein